MGVTLVNSGVIVVRLSRGNVFYFDGNTCMYMDVATPIVCTKTFWLLTKTNGGYHSNVFSTSNNPIWFDTTISLRTSVNFNTGSTNIVSTISQKSTDNWKFYAITMTATKTSLYVDGVLNNEANVNWAGDPARIYFGAYLNAAKYTGWMDDIRLYPINLTSTEIQQLYINTKGNY
jgi:hypothetical protein